MKISNIIIIIMCKAPVPGRVKTRLMSRYSAIEAAQLHAAMATTVIERAKRLFESVVIATDNPKHLFFTPFGLPVVDQEGGNLGDRMQRQVSCAFAEGVDAVMLLGADSPHMADERLLSAACLLKENDIVLGPVEDGGYDLLAMNAVYPLFDGICWSTAQVFNQTLQKAEASGCRVGMLAPDFDVDLLPDLDRAVAAGWNHCLK